MTTSLLARDWLDPWRGRGPVDRWTYLFWGTSLLLAKVLLDNLTCLAFGREWTPMIYLTVPFLEALTLDGFKLEDFSSNAKQHLLFASSLAGTALPFAWAGLSLTARRLQSAGFPRLLTLLFFVPGVNFPFFWLLCVVPPSPQTQMEEEILSDPSAPAQTSFDWLYGSRTYSAIAGVLVASVLGAAGAAMSAVLFERYPPQLFVGLPFMIGFTAGIIHSNRQWRSLNECLRTGAVAGFMACLGAGLVILVVALEGIICLIIAAPILVPMAMFGGMIGAWVSYLIQRHPLPAPRMVALALIAVCAATMAELGVEAAWRPASQRQHASVTSVIVDASPETVWRHVVAFSELPPPQELMFIAGVAYPMRAEIKGDGVGAVRHCVFSTGSFVEPITVWDAPNRLAFDVAEQPDPMYEISPWPYVHPAHLDHAFRSRRGQFLLTRLPDGRTRLDGTTWYTLDIGPTWYWRPVTDYIVHRIHLRVLKHIKERAEEAEAEKE